MRNYNNIVISSLLLEIVICYLMLASQSFCTLQSSMSQEDFDQSNEQINYAKKQLREIYPDADLTTCQLVRKEGYPCEVYSLVSEDGFILQLHRIPQGRNWKEYYDSSNKTERQGQKIVLLGHAALQSSTDWIINGVHNSLAYQLADEGYDVWLMNLRGTTYSYKHVNLTVHDRKYWDYSFHEMANLDLKANIDFILSETHQKDLYYVGHAWGAQLVLIMCSSRPEYNSKIRLAVTLAPALFLGYWRSPIRFMGPTDMINLIVTQTSYGIIGDERVRPDRLTSLIRTLAPGLCKNDMIDDLVCYNFMFLLQGYDYSQTNSSNLPAILARTPTTTSSKSLLHTTQMIKSNEFCDFDYGRRENIRRYGQPTPPLYDFSKITLKVAVMWAPGDYMAAPKNVEEVVRRLPNVVVNHRVNHDKFNHYDFSYAKDAKTLVYDYVVHFIKIY